MRKYVLRPPLILLQGGSGGEPPREKKKVPMSFYVTLGVMGLARGTKTKALAAESVVFLGYELNTKKYRKEL